VSLTTSLRRSGILVNLLAGGELGDLLKLVPCFSSKVHW
jgi:hypothetical protein